MTLVITAVASPAVQSSASPATFSSVNLGTATSGRIIVVCFSSDSMNASDFVTITVAGNAMTLITQQIKATSQYNYQGMFYIVDGTNTSANIVVTANSGGSLNQCGILVYAITGASSSAPTSYAGEVYNYNNDPRTTTSALTIASGGEAIVFGASETASTTVTWNVGSQDYSITNGTNWMMASGHITTTGSVTPSVSIGNGNGWGMLAAAWSPSGGGGGGPGQGIGLGLPRRIFVRK